MYHQADALLALTTTRNEDSYTKTWGTNDFYLKDSDPRIHFLWDKCNRSAAFITR